MLDIDLGSVSKYTAKAKQELFNAAQDEIRRINPSVVIVLDEKNELDGGMKCNYPNNVFDSAQLQRIFDTFKNTRMSALDKTTMQLFILYRSVEAFVEKSADSTKQRASQQETSSVFFAKLGLLICIFVVLLYIYFCVS